MYSELFRQKPMPLQIPLTTSTITQWALIICQVSKISMLFTYPVCYLLNSGQLCFLYLMGTALNLANNVCFTVNGVT